eukprot:scaffold15089_cov168-Amphora_coffeaeformis.AAC.2
MICTDVAALYVTNVFSSATMAAGKDEMSKGEVWRLPTIECLPARTWHRFGYHIVQLGCEQFLA